MLLPLIFSKLLKPLVFQKLGQTLFLEFQFGSVAAFLELVLESCQKLLFQPLEFRTEGFKTPSLGKILN